MARSRARASRAIFGFLAIAVVLGIVFQVHKLRTTHATIKPPAEPPTALASAPVPVAAATTAPAVAVGPLQAGVSALVTSTPGPAGSSSNKPIMAMFSPSTRPAQAQASAAGSPSQVTQVVMGNLSASPAKLALATNGPHATGDVIADAKAQYAANYPLQARQILNDALLNNQLDAATTDTAKQLISQINQQVLLSTKQYPEDPFGGVVTVKPGQRLATIASEHDVTWELLGRLNNLPDPKKLKANRTLKIIKGPFHAVVSKSKFTMDLYLGSPGEPGSLYVMTYRVGLGRDDSTPTGTWLIEPHHKIKHPTYYSPRGEGVIAADDPKNPLGPFWLGLTGTDGQAVGKASYGIHGTIEPDSIGKMSSMGCIRMHNEDVAVVYDLLVEGKSTVLVRD